MEPRLVAVGALLLSLSSLIFSQTGTAAPRGPLNVAAGVSLVLAVGSLLADRRWQDRPT